jgi:hypothetical protein
MRRWLWILPLAAAAAACFRDAPTAPACRVPGTVRDSYPLTSPSRPDTAWVIYYRPQCLAR